MTNRFWFKIYYRNTDGKLKLVGAARDGIVAAAQAELVSVYYGDVTVKCDGLVCLLIPAYMPSSGPRLEVGPLSRRIDEGYEAARARRNARRFAANAQAGV